MSTDPKAAHYADEDERAIISALLNNPDQWPLVASLTPLHFGKHEHQELWSAIRAASGKDCASVRTYLDQHNEPGLSAALVGIHLDPVGLYGISAAMIREVKACAVRRALLSVSERVASISVNPDADPFERTAQLIENLRSLTEGEAAPEQPARRFRPLTVSEVRERPPVPMLIGGVLTEGGLSMIAAPEDNYKSFTALDMAACVATGRAWGGLHPVHHQGVVVYIAGEGVSGMSSRIAAWEQEHKLSLDGKLFLIENSPQLLDSRDVDELVTELLSMEEKPVMLVNDTLACSIAGADENSTKDMTVAEQAVKRIRREIGCHVMTVHHDGKNGMVRGASSYIYAMDTRLSVKRDSSTDSVIVTCEKQKDGERFRPITFMVRKVSIGEDIYHTSLVLLPTQSMPQRPKISAQQQRALEVLRVGMRNSEWQTASGIPEGSFGRIARQLVNAGYVNKQTDGYHVTPEGQEILSQVSDSYHDSPDSIKRELSSLSPPFRGDSDDSSLDYPPEKKDSLDDDTDRPSQPRLRIVTKDDVSISPEDLEKVRQQALVAWEQQKWRSVSIDGWPRGGGSFSARKVIETATLGFLKALLAALPTLPAVGGA